jgi:PTH2 family peptidyl-tRNA hydrolase
MEVKQVIVVRKDLKMRRGKEAAQVAHAAMKVFFDRIVAVEASEDGRYYADIGNITDAMKQWMEGAFTKIVVSCESKSKLFELKAKADLLKTPNAIMVDNGWTEFHNTPTVTCLAVGPDWSDIIDEITKELPLL